MKKCLIKNEKKKIALPSPPRICRNSALPNRLFVLSLPDGPATKTSARETICGRTTTITSFFSGRYDLMIFLPRAMMKIGRNNNSGSTATTERVVYLLRYFYRNTDARFAMETTPAESKVRDRTDAFSKKQIDRFDNLSRAQNTNVPSFPSQFEILSIQTFTT